MAKRSYTYTELTTHFRLGHDVIERARRHGLVTPRLVQGDGPTPRHLYTHADGIKLQALAMTSNNRNRRAFGARMVGEAVKHSADLHERQLCRCGKTALYWNGKRGACALHKQELG